MSMESQMMPMTSPSWMGVPSEAWLSRTARVTSPSRTSALASVMASTTSSTGLSGMTTNSAEKACGTVLVGTTKTCLSSQALAAASAAMRMLPLLGRMMTDSAFTRATASSRSAVEGFMVCPPETTTSTPRDLRISASPEPAATATKPRALAGSTAASWSAWILAVRSATSRSMLWIKTSYTWPNCSICSSTRLGVLECTWTL